jgi:hypothetical protein
MIMSLTYVAFETTRLSELLPAKLHWTPVRL